MALLVRFGQHELSMHWSQLVHTLGPSTWPRGLVGNLGFFFFQTPQLCGSSRVWSCAFLRGEDRGKKASHQRHGAPWGQDGFAPKFHPCWEEGLSPEP